MILACKCSKGRAQGGKVLLAAEPWAKPGSSFTFFFEAFSALLIKGGKLVSGVGKYVGIHEKYNTPQFLDHCLSVKFENLNQ